MLIPLIVISAGIIGAEGGIGDEAVGKGGKRSGDGTVGKLSAADKGSGTADDGGGGDFGEGVFEAACGGSTEHGEEESTL